MESDEIFALIPVFQDGKPSEMPVAIFKTLAGAETLLEQLTGDYAIVTYKFNEKNKTL